MNFKPSVIYYTKLVQPCHHSNNLLLSVSSKGNCGISAVFSESWSVISTGAWTVLPHTAVEWIIFSGKPEIRASSTGWRGSSAQAKQHRTCSTPHSPALNTEEYPQRSDKNPTYFTELRTLTITAGCRPTLLHRLTLNTTHWQKKRFGPSHKTPVSALR